MIISKKHRYDRNPKLCKCCYIVIEYKKRQNSFCSHSCSASFNNRGVAHNGKKRDKRKDCLFCGKLLTNEKQYKFCSQQCQQYFNKQERVKLVEQTHNLWDGWQREGSIKNYLLETKENKCEICCISEWMGKPILLIMDHIDGNSNNWNEDNLRLICSNCDSQLPTYKSKNKGNGRSRRRERYKEGKSY